MSAAEKMNIQAQVKALLVNHPDSAEAVMTQLKEQLFSELVPDEQFRELILEVNDGLKKSNAKQLETVWLHRLLKELIEFLTDTSRDKEFLGLIMADDGWMDSLRENASFIEQIVGELPSTQDLDSDELIGELMKRYHAHDLDIRHFVNAIQLNDPAVMQRRQ